jgi:hypothetical protein
MITAVLYLVMYGVEIVFKNLGNAYLIKSENYALLTNQVIGSLAETVSMVIFLIALRLSKSDSLFMDTFISLANFNKCRIFVADELKLNGKPPKELQNIKKDIPLVILNPFGEEKKDNISIGYFYS